MKNCHYQRLVKVNALVDEGIADLVIALSQFPKLQCYSSCEGDENTPARIFFEYGNPDVRVQETAEFVLGWLGPKLMGKLGDRISIEVCVHETGTPYTVLTVRPGAMEMTIKTVCETKLPKE